MFKSDIVPYMVIYVSRNVGFISQQVESFIANVLLILKSSSLEMLLLNLRLQLTSTLHFD